MLKQFIKYYAPHKKLFFTDMLCALLVALCNLVYPIMTRTFINRYFVDHDLKMIVGACALLLGIYLLKASLGYYIQYYGHVMGVRMQCDMRKDGFEHLQKLPFSYFDQTRTGGIMSRLINDTMDIAELAHHGPEDLFISCFTILGAFLFLIHINVVLTILIFALIPVLVFFAIRMRQRLSRTSMRSRVEIGKINSNLENSIAGIRVSKAYDASQEELDKFRLGNDAFEEASAERYKAMAQFFSGTGFIIDLLSLFTLLFGGLFVYRGSINIADFTAYLMFVNIFTDPIKKLINFMEQFQAGATGFKRLQELLHESPEQDNPSAKELTSVKGDVLFDHVSFSYGESDSEIFSDLTLEIPHGQTVALVGPSGGGKSTLCHLLPRFYETDSGTIYLDGVDIKEYTRYSLRRQIGIVQQDTFLFTGTIRDNIAYGNFDATEEQVREAAKLANIDEYIQTLPDNYNTFVGERGVMLSGGQKQRIAIARIFLKNPPILILDEATSALDNTTEQAIQSAFDALSKGRTTLTVAHRLSTIQHADKIVYIAEGSIKEQGTHTELLAKNGYYATLWNTQIQQKNTEK